MITDPSVKEVIRWLKKLHQLKVKQVECLRHFGVCAEITVTSPLNAACRIVSGNTQKWNFFRPVKGQEKYLVV